MNASALRVRWLGSIGELTAAEWNALATDYPFTRHEFLAALEATGCAAPETGWTPHHLCLYQGNTLVAVAPAWLKSHSWGEFVFDFAWAKAWAERGLRYYPKLVFAVPFTPATGPRFLQRAAPAAAGSEALTERSLAAQLRTAALRAAAERVQELGLSSAHALFIDAATGESCAAAGWLQRTDCQFHWRNQGYGSFEDYLASFTAEKRKKVRRERRRVAEQGISFRTLTGPELDPPLLAKVWELHAATFAAHGHEPYLSTDCFRRLARLPASPLLVKLAFRQEQPVAVAVFFRSSDTLYGRYWGAAGNFHSLHFEACYYQGIELCLELGLKHFEPGTQGEHKLARGFEPTLTRSAHYIADAALRTAVSAYLRREQRAVSEYAAAAAEHLPFHA